MADYLASAMTTIDDSEAQESPILLTPGPVTTSISVRRAMLVDWPSRDDAFLATTKRVRDRLLAISGCGQDFTCVPVQGSGTFALEATLGSLVGDACHVLVLDNGAYGARLAAICGAMGKPHTVLRFREASPYDVQLVADTLEHRPDITHVAAVHCETSSGILNPIQEIVDVASTARRRVIVDAMSTFGAMSMPQGSPVAAIVASANKCLEGVPGVAFVIARRSEVLSAGQNARSLALNLFEQHREFCATGQWRFTPPTHVVAALHQALVELDEEGGPAARRARYESNCSILRARLEGIGLQPLLPPHLQAPVIAAFVLPPSVDFKLLYERVRIRGFVLYPGKLTSVETFRVGCIGRITSADMERAATVIGDEVAAAGLALRKPPLPHAGCKG
jgi:2-aminoethylphosphonate-pyruvate transaminase